MFMMGREKGRAIVCVGNCGGQSEVYFIISDVHLFRGCNIQLLLSFHFRFVKERRPSVSPNFNFLGQMQYFQGTLAPTGCRTKTPAQVIQVPDTGPTSAKTSGDVCYPALLILPNQDTHILDVPKDHFVSKGFTEESQQCTFCDSSNHVNGNFIQGYIQCAEINHTHVATKNLNRENPNEATELTASLSDRIKALTLSLDNKKIQGSSEILIQNQHSLNNIQTNPCLKPTELKVPPGSTSRSDLRKTQTLALFPMETDGHKKQGSGNVCVNNSRQEDQTNSDCSSKHDQTIEAISSADKKRQKIQLQIIC
ncbi:uncharacterized protein LOC135247996 [Anguilla rostrata]|uniref:uncharacterized protein LOC135247996 n=1 Tax=Anguilla rostrata TaxID=7938 RepID=UPI0030D16572